METTIDYRKSVDTMDEGIMALNILKEKKSFPSELKKDLLDILEFLKKVEKPEYEDLLYDKQISISRESLKSIHDRIKDLKFPIEDIENAIKILNKMDSEILETEISDLEKYILGLSQPLWITTILKDEHAR